MLGGEISYSAETVSVRGKLANSGAEQAENSPGDTPPGNISPVVDKNLLLNARDPLTLPQSLHCKLLGLEGCWMYGYISSALILFLTCLLPGAVREKVLGFMGLRSATAWPVLCFQKNLVLINSFKVNFNSFNSFNSLPPLWQNQELNPDILNTYTSAIATKFFFFWQQIAITKTLKKKKSKKRSSTQPDKWPYRSVEVWEEDVSMADMWGSEPHRAHGNWWKDSHRLKKALAQTLTEQWFPLERGEAAGIFTKSQVPTQFFKELCGLILSSYDTNVILHRIWQCAKKLHQINPSFVNEIY